MNEEDFIVKELFAYYGRAIYLAQAIEKGILNLLLFKKLDSNITKTRYDELLYEKSKMTFGQLKRELIDLKIFSKEEKKELNKIHNFHKKRDYLIHNFWWDRAVEFGGNNIQTSLFDELQSYTDFFIELNNNIDDISFEFFKKHNLDFSKIQAKLFTQGKTMEMKQFRELNKNEILTDMFKYNNYKDSLIPIFMLEDNTYWTLCESGLTQYFEPINEENKTTFNILKDTFPVKQFNPRPKISKPWNYELDLKKKGLKIKVTWDESAKRMKWKLDK